jgi:uncharacterized phage-associated protein
MTMNELGTEIRVSVDKPINVISAAKRLCERSGWTLTNLQLQKILYLAQMLHLGKHGSRLINGEFEAWAYGPVLPVLYSQAKIYGGGPIREVFGGGVVFDPERGKMLDDAYDQLGKLSAGRLVSLTHWKDGAWAKYYQPDVRGIKIPDEAIINEYLAHARNKQQRQQQRA